MGASIDEHKPFLAYGGRGPPHARAHLNQGGGLQAWVRRRWPLLLAASLGGFCLLRTLVGPAGSSGSAAGSARLSAGAARVKGCVVTSCVWGAAVDDDVMDERTSDPPFSPAFLCLRTSPPSLV